MTKYRDIGDKRDFTMTRHIVILTITLTLLFMSISCASPAQGNHVPSLAVPLPADGEDAAAHIGDDFLAGFGFSSHLPLVIIDTHGEEIQQNRRWSPERGYAVAIPGAAPYVKADIEIIDTGTGRNRLTDAPAFSSPIHIQLTGDLALPDEKGQYRINLLDASETWNTAALLGMDADNEWLLLGSVADKSLMRNYLAYTLAASIMPYTPDMRYCEVLFKTGEGLAYRGVYLLSESIKYGPGHIDISTRTSARDKPQRWIVRRDYFNPEGVILDTYATKNKLSYGYLALIYPSDEVTQNMVNYIEGRIDEVERVLYADKQSEFITYPKYLDVDSFVNYYILNEYLENYNDGFRSTYLYKDNKGRLKIGPVWDSDGMFDNYTEPVNSDAIAFQAAPWFDRLAKDVVFINKLTSRYSVLQRTVLSNDNVIRLVDEIARYLGPAQQRDWKRWADQYNHEGRLVHRRETDTFEQELIKIKYMINRHSIVIGDELRRLAWADDTIDSSYNTWNGSLFVIGFVVLFFVCVHFGRHH